MSLKSKAGRDKSSAASKKPSKNKTVMLIVAVSSASVIALSIVLISTSWTSYGDAKAEVTSAEANYDQADSKLKAANRAHAVANSAWSSWISCYLTTSWWYTWTCGNESILIINAARAETAVTVAKTDLQQASSRVRSANSDLTYSAAQFNQSVWIWSSLSGLALVALITFGALTLKKNRVERKNEELESRPDWVCPKCSAHNEGGMFCIGCGFAKSDFEVGEVAKAVTSDSSPEAEAEAEPRSELKE